MELLWVSNLMLWIAVIVLAVIVFALARQIGLLHERIAPAGALTPTSGPKVGELVSRQLYSDLAGTSIAVGGAEADARATLILFTSPTCPVCRQLVPVARSVARRERLRLLFASDGGDIDTHRRYAADMELEAIPYLVSQALGLRFEVSKLPFAVLIDGDGTLAARGLVNTREHLESLLESMRTGITSIQDYLTRERGHDTAEPSG